MIKLLVQFILTLALWATALFAFDFFITQYFLIPKGFGSPILRWHTFIGLLTLLGGIVTLILSRWRFHYTGFTFMAVMLLKIGIAIMYLWPLLRQSGEPPVDEVLHFMAIYISYLLFEAAFVLRYLNHNSPPL